MSVQAMTSILAAKDSVISQSPHVEKRTVHVIWMTKFMKSWGTKGTLFREMKVQGDARETCLLSRLPRSAVPHLAQAAKGHLVTHWALILKDR
jgi:hypothetical protein